MTHPQRLRTDEFLAGPTPVRVIKQCITQPVAAHWHEFYELYFGVEGEADHAMNGRTRRLSHGSVFLVTPADIHEIKPTGDGPLRGFNVIFEKRVIRGEVEQLLIDTGDGGITEWAIDGFDEAEADFQRMWRESIDDAPGQGLLVESILQCALVELIRRCRGSKQAGSTDRRPTADPRIRQALHYIDHHFREPMTLAAVAAQVHLSPNYFSEHFHATTGDRFQSYLQGQRLRFARSLLSSTDLPITDICYAAGFNDLSHFGRAFRRRFDLSPSAFREVVTETADDKLTASRLDDAGSG